MKVATGMVVPVFPTFHTKSDSGWRWVRAGILTGGIPGSVVRGQRLTSKDALLESTTSKVSVVFKEHADDNNGDPSIGKRGEAL